MPKLVCIGGLPGVGKTTLGLRLCDEIPNSALLDPDFIRLEIVGKNPRIDQLVDQDITDETTVATIQAMKIKAQQYLQQDKTVIVASAFILETMREEYELLAKEVGAIFTAIWLEVDIETRVKRGNQRRLNSANLSGVSEAWIRNIRVQGNIHWPIVEVSKALEEVVFIAKKKLSI